MRIVLVKYLLFCTAFICFFQELKAQNGNSFEGSLPYISAYFTRESVVIEPDGTFFNVLIIKNQGHQPQDVVVELNVPIGWSVVATENMSRLISPGDSVIFPVRAAPSKGVEGEIGYSVIASINDRRGELLTNAYSFVKVPRKADLQIRPLSRLNIFDQATNEADFSVAISNQGNVSELVFLLFQSSDNIDIPEERDNLFSVDLMVPAKTDTIVTLKAIRLEDVEKRNGGLYRIDLKASSRDQVYNSSFWFDYLTTSYKYKVPLTEKVLIVNLSAQNLLSGKQSYINGGVRGVLFFNNESEFLYNVQKYGSDPDFLKFSRIALEYIAPSFDLFVGDVLGVPIRSGFGKGGAFRYKHNKTWFAETMVGKNFFRPVVSYGAGFGEMITPLNLTGKYVFSNNEFFNSEAHFANIGISSRFQTNQLQSTLGFSSVDYKDFDRNEMGFGLLLNYSGRFNNTTVSAREQFGSNTYFGSFAGRHDFALRVNHPFSERYTLNFMINDRHFRPILETNEGTNTDRFQRGFDTRALLQYLIDRNLTVYGGPIFERKSSNSFSFFDQTTPFKTQSSRLNFGARLRDGMGTTFNPSATLGYTYVTAYSLPPTDSQIAAIGESTIFNTQISMNLRRPMWGVFLNYFYGPYSINQEISQFYTGFGTNSIRVMPYIERFIYRDILKLSVRSSFLHDFSYKTSRLILNTQLDAYLPNDISFAILNTYSYQVTTDLITEDNYTYSNNYFELRAEKEFNWNQPRMKYHDLNVQLFIDLNGNLVKDVNEPGVKDILVNLSSIDPILYSQYGVDYNPQGNLMAARLLTTVEGLTTYENLSRGLYQIELTNIGKEQGKYFPDKSEYIVNLTGNETLYIPYLERNKIFGRVVLNRSRLSTLGRIEVSNIKVTATDSKGRQTSALSDADGNFEMYVPSVDSYIVTINNIFRDHFSLRQNNFRANLNGFKQFEVNFVFDEIRRQIEFTPSAQEIQTEIRRVGRTNLSGTVRDATTLQPIRAVVEVVDNTTGSTVVQVNTDRNTGKYNTSFATGEDLMIVITANGYWMQSERLILDQFLTIQDSERDILLENVTIGARFQLNNLSFEAGSSDIITDAMPELDRMAAQLARNPNVQIRIEGHSDAIETLDNPNISMQRAEAVMRYIVQKGFSNIEFTGLKDSRPIAPNDTEDNRRRNRRVEIIVVDR